MLRRKYFLNVETLHGKYIIAFLLGAIVGLKAIPVPVVAWVYILLAVVCLYNCIKGDVPGLFGVLPYVMYTEVFIRASARWVPYLTLQYLLIICFTILLFTAKKLRRPHSNSFFLLLLFTFVEVTNNVYPAKVDVTRAILTNSFALLLPVIWASYNVLSPLVINKLLNHVKTASIFLAGIVFVAHFTGKINYGLYSNSEASNGLAPVQLSAYLGLGCILFFLAIMNPEEVKNRLINIIVLAVASTVMVLTFSRGGLYFMGAVICLYLLFNRAQMGQYVRLLIFIPIGLFIYMYVVNQTGGKIVARYEQEGTSNRDVLVHIGFVVFQKNLLFGVGTGNYNTTIVKEGLFKEESGAHNEFVRAAAEHGIVGIILYWGFYVVLGLEILRRRRIERQYGLYFFVLFCMIIVHNGLKISIQPLLIMIVVATPSFLLKQQESAEHKELERRKVA